jgi:hypothetical protein
MALPELSDFSASDLKFVGGLDAGRRGQVFVRGLALEDGGDVVGMSSGQAAEEVGGVQARRDPAIGP